MWEDLGIWEDLKIWEEETSGGGTLKKSEYQTSIGLYILPLAWPCGFPTNIPYEKEGGSPRVDFSRIERRR